jgi:hypothetical protein
MRKINKVIKLFKKINEYSKFIEKEKIKLAEKAGNGMNLM